jgi:hypothetical protein
MSYTSHDLEDIIKDLFTISFYCTATRTILSILNHTKAVQIKDDTDAVCKRIGTFMNQQITRTETSPIEDSLIAAFTGDQFLTKDMESKLYPDLMEPQLARLTTAQIADIINQYGVLTLLNPKDSVTIYNLITRYLDALAFKQSSDPHYRINEATADDLAAFKKLQTMLSAMANRYNTGNLGVSTLDSLLRLMTPLADSDTITKVVLNGVSNTASYSSSRPRKNPYRFDK